jgi:hypothetical protein
MEMDNPPRSAWRNFPDVLIHAQESAVKKHADYLAAKSGEIASARRVVEATLNDNMVNALGSIAASSNPVLASVHAYEAEGINRIPAVFAEVLAERLGLRAEAGIVQSNRTGHTGATGYHRLAHPAMFEGEFHRSPRRDHHRMHHVDGQAMVGQTDAFRRYVAKATRETWRRT